MTDKEDYAPGTPVHFTGSGWIPGVAVTISMTEDPFIDQPATIVAMADAAGNISDSSFAPDINDVGIKFYVTATQPGPLDASGNPTSLTAQTSFTDGNPDNTSMTVSCSPNPISVGNPTTCTAQVNNTQSGAPAGYPQGTVKFSLQTTGMAGGFSPSDTCTLLRIGTTVNSSCSAAFTPSTGVSGTVKGQYNSSPGNWNNDNAQTSLTAPWLPRPLSLRRVPHRHTAMR
jgi:hypothetical protein